MMYSMVKKPELVDGRYVHIKNHFTSVQEENRTALNRLSADEAVHRGGGIVLKKRQSFTRTKFD